MFLFRELVKNSNSAKKNEYVMKIVVVQYSLLTWIPLNEKISLTTCYHPHNNQLWFSYPLHLLPHFKSFSAHAKRTCGHYKVVVRKHRTFEHEKRVEMNHKKLV